MFSSFKILLITILCFLFVACSQAPSKPSVLKVDTATTKELVNPEKIRSGDIAILSDGSILVARKNYNKNGTLFGMIGPRDVIIKNYSRVVKIVSPEDEKYRGLLKMLINQAKKEAREK